MEASLETDALIIHRGSLQTLSENFETAQPEKILSWALESFPRRAVALATGFGVEGCALVSMLAGIDRNARIFYLDTGVLFPETYALRDRLEAKYGVRFERWASNITLDEQEVRYGKALWERQPDQCCQLRKVEPLKCGLAGLSAWITAVRRDQTQARKRVGIVEWDEKFGLIKINPLANWSSSDVWNYVLKYETPYNPLHDHEYPSIGCQPCTSPVKIGEDPRAGRWRGKEKTECGLHQ